MNELELTILNSLKSSGEKTVTFKDIACDNQEITLSIKEITNIELDAESGTVLIENMDGLWFRAAYKIETEYTLEKEGVDNE